MTNKELMANKGCKRTTTTTTTKSRKFYKKMVKLCKYGNNNLIEISFIKLTTTITSINNSQRIKM